MTALNTISRKITCPLAVLILLSATLLVYADSFLNSFVWDDYSVVVENNFIKSWDNFPRLFNKSYLTGILDLDYLGQRDIGSGEISYRPMVTLSYFVDFSLWKLNAFGYHLTSLILHILNAMLFFSLVNLITDNRGLGLLAALFFALHPVNAEAVNVIAFREDILVFFFLTGAFIMYIKSKKAEPAFNPLRKILPQAYSPGMKVCKGCASASGREPLRLIAWGGSTAAFYSGSLLMFFLALFSKETAIILPLLLLCYDYFFARQAGNAPARPKKSYTGYACLLLFYFLVRFVLMNNSGHQLLSPGMADFSSRLLALPKIIITYLGWMVFPVNIHPTLPDDPAFIVRSLLSAGFLLPLAATLIVLAAAVRISRRMPDGAFALSWIFISLIPVSNIIFPLTNYLAARYLYLPAAGFCFLLAALLLRRERTEFAHKLSRDLIAVILAFYAIFTCANNMNWRNNQIFWSEMAERYPGNALAHSSLANAYRRNGLLDRAIAEYKIALSLSPDYAKDHNDLGACYYEKTMYPEAIIEFKQAVGLNPVFLPAYVNLGSALGEQGAYQEAIRYFKKAIQIDKKALSAYNGLGVTYARMGDYAAAKQAWEHAAQVDPDNQQARENLNKLKPFGY